MANEFPNDVFQRSEKMEERSDINRSSIQELIQDRARPFRQTKSDLEDLLSTRISMGIVSGLLIMGLLFLFFGIFFAGSKGMIGFGFLLLILGGIPAWLTWRFVVKNEARDERMFAQSLDLGTHKEVTRINTMSNMVVADGNNQILQAQLAGKELDYAFIVTQARELGLIQHQAVAAEVSQDLRNKDQELAILGKLIEQERAKSQSRVNEITAEATAAREMRRLEQELAEKNIVIEKQRFDMTMNRLAKEQSHALRLQAQQEIGLLRKAIVAYTQMVQHNPALEAELNQAATALDALMRILDRSEFDSMAAQGSREVFDTVLSQFLFNKLGVRPPQGNDGSFEA